MSSSTKVILVTVSHGMAENGTIRFEKAQWHVHYVFTPHSAATGPIQGKWVGFKAIMYNIEQNGITALKEEIWLDPNNTGNWVKVNEFTDAGGFGNDAQVCGGCLTR